MLGLAFLHFDEPWYIYVSMPLISAAIGYVTKLVAIEMIFRPTEFVGIKPFLGWQGMVPRRAAKMAGIAVDSVMGNLLQPEELIDLVDPDELVAALAGPLRASIAELTATLITDLHPGLWEAMPPAARSSLISRVESRVPGITHRLTQQTRDNIDLLVDIRQMVVINLVRDKVLLNRMMRDISQKALTFMARAGAIFGFYIGCVQVTVFIITGSHLVLPIFGLITGGTTDWIALHMIFRPVEPGQRLFRIMPWQGIFHKLRDEVTHDYATLLAREILTPRVLMERLLRGPTSDRVYLMIEQEIKRTIDEEAGIVLPVVRAVRGQAYERMKQRIADSVLATVPEEAARVEAYTGNALSLDALAAERMQLMSSDQYEELLRPAFRDDEKTVVAVGAILGFLVGELQAVLLL